VSSPLSECRWFALSETRPRSTVVASADAGKAGVADGRADVKGRRCLPLVKCRALVGETARRIRLNTLLSSYR
jgi:hypothetical protein